MTIAELIESYKGDVKPLEVEAYNNQYNVKKHAIFTDLARFPNRNVVTDYIDSNGIEQKKTITIPLNRIGLPYQKKIVSIATTFFCGNPIKYTNNIPESKLFEAFQAVINKNKMGFIDRETLDACGRFTEVAELWYHTEEDNDSYGFNSKFRLKVKVLTPDIYKMYPIFDENEDLVSFSREFKIGEKTIFEVYTADVIERYEKEKDWVLIERKLNPIGKIPIVYRKQDDVEWADVQSGIERLEQIYSNSAESNDRFSFPILAIHGKVTGQLSNDKSGRVLQMTGEGSKAEFVSQPNANTSVADEVSRLERDIHDFTNTPNISFDNMKGLGNMLAGASAEFLFLSAHLKVMDKLSIHIPALERRASVISAYLKMFNVSFKNDVLDIKPIVTPFIINNDADFIKFLMEANGGQPIYSQEHSMELAGVKNPKEMIQEINNESEGVVSNQFV